MGNMQGWSLSARLIAKHFGEIGTSLATMLANESPDTATAADREQLAESVRSLGMKYAQAKTAFERESEDVQKLAGQIKDDENAAAAVAAQLTAGRITEATARLFCDELEGAKRRLPQEEQEAKQAKAFMEEVKSLLDELAARLTEFDEAAKSVRSEVASAQAEVDLERQRQEHEEQLGELRDGGKGESTALGAMRRRAEELRTQAAGLKAYTDIVARPGKEKEDLAALRASIKEGGAGRPSTLDRLASLAAAG